VVVHIEEGEGITSVSQEELHQVRELLACTMSKTGS